MKTFITIVLSLLCCFSVGCKKHPKGVMNDKELKAYVEAHLKPGDSKEKIEQFFRDNGWNYGFNRFEPSYVANYKQGDVNTSFEMSGVAVFVYVDANNAVKEIKVDRAYTGL